MSLQQSLQRKVTPQLTEKKTSQTGETPFSDGDFILSDEKVGDYYIGVRKILTNLLVRGKSSLM